MVKARKPHKCYECGAVINSGDAYQYTAGKWDGYFDQFRWCVRCVAARDTFVKHSECACWAYGGLWDILRDEWEAEGKIWLGRIIAAAKKKWIGIPMARVFVGPIK
jgi:hypothetical protein